MALPFTDAFTNSNGTALTTHNASYSNQNGVCDIQSNGVHPNSASTEIGVRWGGDTFGDDQYSQLVMVAETSGTYIGPACRMASGANSRYGYYAGGDARYFFKVITGTFTQFGSSGGSPAVNDVLRIEASSSTITAKLNGAVDTAVGTSGTASDSSLTTGYGGITGWHNSTTRGDDLDTGNLSTPASDNQSAYMVGAVITYEQEGFRFRNDNGSETTATWMASQDTDASVARETNFRLRALIDTAQDAPSRNYKLQYHKVGAASWRDVP